MTIHRKTGLLIQLMGLGLMMVAVGSYMSLNRPAWPMFLAYVAGCLNVAGAFWPPIIRSAFPTPAKAEAAKAKAA